MSKKKLLLLNPPGRKLYLRDYFCSKVSQADYLNHPIDLLQLSGYLDKYYFLDLIDSIVESKSVEKTLRDIKIIAPDIIVGLIGSVSYSEDVAFYKRLAAENRTRIILIGDVLIDKRKTRLESLPGVEAFLHDFTTNDLINYLSNEKGNLENLYNMTVRKNGVISENLIRRIKNESYSIPIPRHDLFLKKKYRYPFVKSKRFATVLTEFGCPYPCTFCIMSTLGWKTRTLENVEEELVLLSKLNVTDILLLDQTFGLGRDRPFELLSLLKKMRCRWTCFSRPDVISEKLIQEMKASGCHTVIMGLESGNEQILATSKKQYVKSDIVEGFRLCRLHGIRTVATVILGLPDETEDSFEETLTFLKTVSPDYASFNVAVPRMGTQLRSEAIKLGLSNISTETMDQSGTFVCMPSKNLTEAEILQMKKRAIKEFYISQQYLFRKITNLRLSGRMDWEDLFIQLRQGIALVRNLFFTKN